MCEGEKKLETLGRQQHVMRQLPVFFRWLITEGVGQEDTSEQKSLVNQERVIHRLSFTVDTISSVWKGSGFLCLMKQNNYSRTNSSHLIHSNC